MLNIVCPLLCLGGWSRTEPPHLCPLLLAQDKEVSPTFGFNAISTTTTQLHLPGPSWRASLAIYDLGGGRSIRRVWRSYLAEVSCCCANTTRPKTWPTLSCYSTPEHLLVLHVRAGTDRIM
jgi:hypothetical protein